MLLVFSQWEPITLHLSRNHDTHPGDCTPLLFLGILCLCISSFPAISHLCTSSFAADITLSHLRLQRYHVSTPPLFRRYHFSVPVLVSHGITPSHYHLPKNITSLHCFLPQDCRVSAPVSFHIISPLHIAVFQENRVSALLPFPGRSPFCTTISTRILRLDRPSPIYYIYVSTSPKWKTRHPEGKQASSSHPRTIAIALAAHAIRVHITRGRLTGV
jgi:hypothetical protein